MSRIYAKLPTDYTVILGHYRDSKVKYISYDKFRKKTLLAKGECIDGEDIINSDLVFYLNEDELIALRRVLREVKSMNDFYEILSETKKDKKSHRLVLKTNQWGGLVLCRSTGSRRVGGATVVVEDDDPDPEPITPEQFQKITSDQKEWKDSYETFHISSSDNLEFINKSIAQYYTSVPDYNKEPVVDVRSSVKRKAEKAPKQQPQKSRKKKKIVEENDDDDDDNESGTSANATVNNKDMIIPLSFLFTIMKTSGKSLYECIAGESEFLREACESVGLDFDYVDFYKKFDEKSILTFYSKVRDLL